MKSLEGIAEREAVIGDSEFADRVLVSSRTLFDDGDCSTNASAGFEIPEQNYAVREIGQIDGRPRLSGKPMLRYCQEGTRALAVEILQQLMHVQNERVLLGHGRLVAVEAINDDGPHLVSVNGRAHFV